MTAIIRVQTRDSHLVPYDPRKIVSTILEAMTSAGEGGADLAEELGAAVGHFLGERAAGSIVSVDEIEDMIEKVLMETGNRRLARAHILLREKHSRIRERIRVRSTALGSDGSSSNGLASDGSGSAFPSPWVEGGSQRSAEPWSRDRITHALIEEADLDAPTAEEIASAVEGRVFRSGLRSISTSLLRELVDNELFERGHTASLKRQSPLVLPKYDLEKALFHGGDPGEGLYPGDPLHLAQLVGNRILRQYVLEEVYPRSVREAHFGGRIHLHQLEHSLQIVRASICADETIASPPRDNRAEGFFPEVFRRVTDLLGGVAEEIEVYRLGEGLLAERQRTPASGFGGDLHRGHPTAASSLQGIRGEGERGGGREPEGSPSDPAAWPPVNWARHLIRAVEDHRALRDALPGSTPTVTLRFPLTPRFAMASHGGDLFAAAALREDTSLFLALTLEQALREPGGARALCSCQLKFEISSHTFRDRRYLNTLRSILELLPRDASLSFVVVGEETCPAAPALHLGGKVTLNLPRVALEARREGGDLDEALAVAVQLACEALARRGEFLQRLALHPDGPLAGIRRGAPAAGRRGESPGLEYVIGLLGLDDAVRILTGESLHESESARRQGLDVVDRIAALVVAGAAGGAQPVLEETPYRGPLRRFEKLDRDRFGRVPPAPGNPEGGAGYASGLRFGRWAPVDPLRTWRWLDDFRQRVRFLDRLDDIAQLRSDGVEVVLAFLEEVCRHRVRRSGLGTTGGNPNAATEGSPVPLREPSSRA